MRLGLPLLLLACAALGMFLLGGGSPALPAVDQILPVEGSGLSLRAGEPPQLEPRRSLPSPEEQTPGVPYRLIDAETGAGLAGARILRARDGELLAHCDATGAAEVRGVGLDALVFGADGYLCEHFFDRREEALAMARRVTALGHVLVPLQRDHWSVRRRLTFVDPDDAPVAPVEFELKPLETQAELLPALADSLREPGRRAAWQRHTLLTSLRHPDFNPQICLFDELQPQGGLRAEESVELRFACVGRYRIRARSGALFREMTLDVDASPDGELKIQLRAGTLLRGVVVEAGSGRAVIGARVELWRDGDRLAGQDAAFDGSFALGPLGTQPCELRISHPGYEKYQQTGVRPATGQRYELQPARRYQLRGRVLNRAGGEPIRGARLRVVDGAGAGTRSAADGGFEFSTPRIEPMLEILAEGFLPYRELLNANGQERQFLLIPADPEVRCRAGLTSLTRVTVLDRSGQPAAGQPLIVEALRPPRRPSLPGRRILIGGMLPRSGRLTSNAQGQALVEWPVAEALRLRAADGTELQFAATPGKQGRLELQLK